MIRTRTTAALAGCLLLVASCKKDKKTEPSAASSASAHLVAPAASASAAASAKPLYADGKYPIPTGPRLAILPGEGVGPIRFGASFETIERLMDKPCEVRTETACRYIGRGVEFFMKDGALHEIRIHRLNRPTEPEPRVFGVFNGRFIGGAMFGMFREAVAELYGKPSRTEAIEKTNAANTVEVHIYDKENMRLEYDKLDNGNVVLGGVILRKAEKAKASGVGREK